MMNRHNTRPAPGIRDTACALVIVFGGLGLLPASAAEESSFLPAFDRLGLSLLSRSVECETDLNDGMDAALECLGGLAIDEVLISATTRLAGEKGRERFGENFRIVERLSFAPTGGGLSGDLDIVLPFSAGTGAGNALELNALFLQQGVTRWKDERGVRRNDIRLGAVRRFGWSKTEQPDVFGISAFIQQNLEHEHTRLVAGADYLGSWGRGSLNTFVPTTDWQPVSQGYSERALAGTELGLHLDLTSTLSFESAVGRWENTDGLGDWSTQGRLGMGLRPHPWVNIGLAWQGIGTENDSSTFRVALEIPLGGTQKPPRFIGWKGLGVVGDATNAAPDPWRPIEHVGAISVATRNYNDIERLVQEASVRILEDRVSSGGDFRLQVTLPSAAPQDLRLMVNLVPGTGQRPAVPGEDYVDEPIEVIVSQGHKTSAIVTVRLLLNPDMEHIRTIGATVDLAVRSPGSNGGNAHV